MIRFRRGNLAAILRQLSVPLTAVILFLLAVDHAQGQSVMTRHLRPQVRGGQAKFLNRLPGTQTLRFDIVLLSRDQAGLDKFLQEIYDPTSPSYRHFLTVAEFTERFGPSQEDYNALIRYVRSNGLKVVGGSRDGMDLQLEGSVTSIEAAFDVSMGVYQHPTENRSFYAPDREPMLALPFPVWHISGLDNYSIPRPASLHRNLSVRSNTTTGSCPSSSYCGSDMRAAYYGNGPLTGAGQSVGLLEFYGYDSTDLTTYFNNSGQTNRVPIVGISTDGTSLTCHYSLRCDDTEQILDITQAVSMAPGLSALYVFVGSSDTAILSSMSTHTPLSAQLSSSWSWSPADPGTDDPFFKKFAAQGQNFFQAAGDNGKYTSSSTYVYPADDAYVTSVGGTDLATTGPDGSWLSETAWADGGGGYYKADAIPIPAWQQVSGVITTTNQGSAAYRNAPDVAAESNFDYYVCANQTACTANYYGGTSFAAPLWAGYMALVNQQAALNGNAPLGFINPLIYQLGLGSDYATDFHDITSGSNGYSAATGYDLATGWGSPNGAGLIAALAGVASAPNFSISSSSKSVSVAQGSRTTSTITTVVSGGFNSAIALSATGQPTGVTAGFTPASIVAPGSGTSTMTVTVASTTRTGTYTITISGNGGSITHTATVTLTVTGLNPDFSISASPSPVTVARRSSGQATISTTALGSFNSSVSLAASGLPVGASVGFAPKSISAPGSGSSTMLISVGNYGVGTHTLTIKGTGGGKTHSTTVSLIVK